MENELVGWMIIKYTIARCNHREQQNGIVILLYSDWEPIPLRARLSVCVCVCL